MELVNVSYLPSKGKTTSGPRANFTFMVWTMPLNQVMNAETSWDMTQYF